MLLRDRIGIVSGIGPGVGRAVALAFAREGADVVLAARTAAALDAVAAEVEALGRRALRVPTDIAEPADCRRLVERTLAAFGRVDVLVNNAFLTHPWGPIESADFEAWRRIYDVNLFGSLRLSQLVLPAMRAQGGGSIVMVNTMSMRIIEPNVGGYASSKAALMTATQTLAKEVGKDGIRVNSVVPGYIWSEKMEAYFRHLATEQGRTYEQVFEDVAGRTALHRIPDSAEIADAVVFFASDLSRAVTGQALDVNGGHYFH
ncbi:MAG TPA: SDR family oxidoreductase [Candidatus Limnocylindria bacterium]|nr:SDR family oxidoreductase [Candidatus Limnocylindria bacterium]